MELTAQDWPKVTTQAPGWIVAVSSGLVLSEPVLSVAPEAWPELAASHLALVG